MAVLCLGLALAAAVEKITIGNSEKYPFVANYSAVCPCTAGPPAAISHLYQRLQDFMSFSDRKTGVIARGMIDATGMPALVLFASMVGYGSMARESGLTLWTAVASTALLWGLPGQIAMVELYALGAPVIAVIAASSAANARFLPMVLSVMPLLNEALPRKRWRYAAAQFMSLNPWAALMRCGPGMDPVDRPPYYAGFAGVCIGAALLGTGTGFVLAGVMPRDVTLTLVFLNPVFFTLVFADARGRAAIAAVLAGVVAGPLFHLVSPNWGLLLTGAVAGTGVYLVDRIMRRRDG